MKRIASGVIAVFLIAAVLAAGCTSSNNSNKVASNASTVSSVATTTAITTTNAAASASATRSASASIVDPTPPASSAKIATTIHVWAGYMGMPAFWLEDPQNNPVAQGSEQQVRYWIDAADGTQPCGTANYYIDNQAAGGAWDITKPQPQYWQGCPSGLAGGAGGLYLYARDTSQLRLGWHTLTIDYLGDSTYAPSQFVAQFLVVA